MSRYNLQSKDPNHIVVVGWDRPLNTFFAQVRIAGADEEARPLLWFGVSGDGIHDIDEVKRRLSPFAIVPYDIELQLRRDSD